MKYIFTIIILTLSLLTFSQKTEKVKKKFSVDGITVKEKYYVLKSDTSIRHGEYKRYDVLNDLQESGFYKMGVKDSIWKTYILNKYIGSIGYYRNDKKSGVWKYYTNVGTKNPNYDKKSPLIMTKHGSYSNDSLVGIWNYYKAGELEQKFDYSSNTIIFPVTNETKNIYYIKNDSGIITSKLDRPPYLVGGNTARVDNWKKMDHSKLSTLSNNSQDISYALSFWIKPDGTTYDYKMAKSVNAEYDNYIIEYYKANYKWTPGVLNGNNVECQVIVSNGYIVKM